MENKEIASLAESLVLAFAYAENGLAQLLEDYEIIDVEQIRVIEGFGSRQFVSIEDGLLRARSDGEYYVLSFKTSSERWGERSAKRGLYDEQGISEIWAVIREKEIKPLGVKMIYLMKGQKKFDDLKNDWWFDNFLTRAWTTPGLTEAERVWKHTKYWACPLVAHTLASGRRCKGDGSTKNHMLPDSFQQVRVADYRELGGWISELGELQDEMGQQVLQRVVITPETYFRSEKDIREWEREAIIREGIIGDATHTQYEDLSDKSESWDFRDYRFHQVFPKNRNACTNDYGRLCWAIPLCFQGVDQDPLGSGLFKLRERSQEDERIDQMRCTSRSRGEVYRQCPRKRWWAYEWGKGQPLVQLTNQHAAHIGGLASLTQSVDAIIGSAVHKGLAFLLKPFIKNRGHVLPEQAGEAGEAGEVARKECLENLPPQVTMQEGQLKEEEENLSGLGIY